MYHQVGEPADAERRYVVTERAFDAQMESLSEGGFEVVSVGGALAAPSSRPRVVLTFDDGSASDRLFAADRLRARGFGATFYAVPGLFGRPGFLTAAQARELVDMGFEVGSHSMTHRYLTDLDPEALREEVAGSKRSLEDVLGRRVRHFACPGGRVDRRVTEAVRAAGYDSLATSRIGVNAAGADAFALARVPVYRQTTLGEFRKLSRARGLRARQLPGLVLDAAKRVLGNDSYDRLRRFVLQR
jgi:peptidoglycan/xylan/chitin deacetylase (PgdA/CDA1 family)